MVIILNLCYVKIDRDVLDYREANTYPHFLKIFYLLFVSYLPQIMAIFKMWML